MKLNRSPGSRFRSGQLTAQGRLLVSVARHQSRVIFFSPPGRALLACCSQFFITAVEMGGPRLDLEAWALSDVHR
jgi:hypothetical protein